MGKFASYRRLQTKCMEIFKDLGGLLFPICLLTTKKVKPIFKFMATGWTFVIILRFVSIYSFPVGKRS